VYSSLQSPFSAFHHHHQPLPFFCMAGYLCPDHGSFSLTRLCLKPTIPLSSRPFFCLPGAFQRVLRTYDNFFDLQCWLLDAFPVEAGLTEAPR
jgi:hypothetical protein